MRIPTVTCFVHDPQTGRIIEEMSLPVGTEYGLTASERLRAWANVQHPYKFWTIQNNDVHNPTMETSSPCQYQ